MQIYSITSGKGGVGKTSLVCNIAYHFGQFGKRVLLIDADMGLANVDIVMGLAPKANLSDLFLNDTPLDDILVEGPKNVAVLPASSGVREMTQLSDEHMLKFMGALDGLEREFDVLLVDTGAGIGKNVLYFNAAANDVIVVATPQPTSITDAYATMKVLSNTYQVKRFRLLVNQVTSRKEALKVYRYLTTVSDKYLDIAIDYLGHVRLDDKVNQAVMERGLFSALYPDSPAAQCVGRIVTSLVDEGDVDPSVGSLQFFWRRLMQKGA
jgi:flagellar biosynthesis protein FlhG